MAQMLQELVFLYMGIAGPTDREPVIGGEIGRAAQRLIDIVDAFASGAFVPNQEKDELTYALQTLEHPGRTQGKGLISWQHGFPKDAATYRSRQQRKDEEAERIRMLEEAVLQSRERELNMELRMQEEIKQQVALQMSSQRQSSTSEHAVNISPLAKKQLRFH
jgi:hypothetical protein